MCVGVCVGALGRSGQREEIYCRASVISTSPMAVIDVEVSSSPLTVRDGR